MPKVDLDTYLTQLEGMATAARDASPSEIWPRVMLALIRKTRELDDALSPCERCQLGTDWVALHTVEAP